MEAWFVYLLRCADNTLYCGVTNDMARRLARHNAGTASRYTRSRTPVTLVAAVETPGKGDALRLEIAVKKQPKDRKITFLQSWG
ncbi:MAG: GIY-YIG nuclease family protein [Pseudodesulfovibrio sp.]|uniref:Excinuclease ABC C subunit domain protein n=1 Tax=Pseudodesulfovibrio aespoeensis (strain ATCC 700646 / DSM 10631 / Aspo-2) TaxID=643562 RepID=E6VUT2_PSEA9|nr:MULTISPECIES: GIY-YIG nuclease family protein [Pseudodesulfovibrio]MBU4191379.1 GIY-YIG nuclease family protein [Pseudomonadota bacterium]ADU62323.1 Excinuclease ABC C subunit domain protein [Pseudodesulfovibrio aespoeensis Aspo-2]MBU4380053.1 GIY-YIG nuclease family protein [Pseudomonadota bacterium]MBU4474012.1 GIY-YIG nuclease family protein [Pseudomonadota bacterium]MBU4515210.1 GIY-YIG nuclease family protein [Pseudomonadota bacterium]